MTYRPARPLVAGVLFCCLAAPAVAIDVPVAAWGAYGTYYDNAETGSGTLVSRLRTLISNMNGVDYDDARVSQAITDRIYGMPAGSKMWGVYDRTQLTPSATSTWNREHVWPQSKLGSASDHDLFGLRPANINTNGSRGNNSFGGIYDTGAPRLLAVRTDKGAKTAQFFPGDVEKGDVARSIFYMATRYSNLNLVATYDGLTSTSPANTNLGDKEAALHWHYADLPDNFERRRNQYIYSNAEKADVSGTYYSQHNRNPYVDHPEYVWSVFGDAANDSQITLGSGGSGGATTQTVDFGRVIVGGVAPALSTNVAITKTGADPTTFSVATTGLATADGTDATVRKNVYNAFDYGGGTKTLPVGLTGVTTAAAGRKGGTVVLDNTDLTTQAGVPNSGSADGDDTVDLSLTVLDHSNASFAKAADIDTLYVNFQTVNFGDVASRRFTLANLMTAGGFTAGLDLDSVTATGDTDAFGTNLAPFAAMTAGTSADYAATFSPTRAGRFSATFTLGVSDENLSGATGGNALTIVMSGMSNARALPEPAVLSLLSLAAAMLRRRRPVPSPGTPGEG